jgi:signal transduction histidine kinase
LDGDGQRLGILMVQDTTQEREARAALVKATKLSVTGQLAAAFAHEIRNPLQGVLGCLSLLDETVPQEEQSRRYFRVANREIRRVDEIVTRLLDLHDRPQDVERDRVGLNGLLRETLVLVESQTLAQGIDVALDLDADLPKVPVLEDQIRQVLLNLVLNAIEAMPSGGELRVATRTTRDPDGVSIEVSDTGSGIPPKDQAHIFDFLHTTKTTGTGLGLYVSLRIVRRHGGELSFESSQDQGSVFQVWLPLDPDGGVRYEL